MSHEPMLSTDLFEDIDKQINLFHSRTEPFNLLEFLFKRGEFQTVVDIYGACTGFAKTKQSVRPSPLGMPSIKRTLS